MADIQWSSPQSLSYIDPGKLVTFTAMHQAEDTQYVQIIDASNQPISFYCLDGSQAKFPISGSGTEVGFLQNGAGRFTMASGMQVQFGSSGPYVPLVAASTEAVFFLVDKMRGGGVLYVTEDGGPDGDMDYNDTSVVIQWYETPG